MGLLDKLFGGKNEVPETKGRAKSGGASAGEAKADGTPCSWGDKMPEEENQYSFPGTHTEYFEKIFREEFPQFTVERSDIRNGWITVYRFLSGSRTVLVVELMTEKSVAVKLRETCRSENIPYQRFYYDHRGWWNTRSYVVGRIKGALGISQSTPAAPKGDTNSPFESF